MAAGPQRRTEPARHLGAHPDLVPLERALHARASELGQQAGDQMINAETVAAVRALIAAEFRALADELHHWD